MRVEKKNLGNGVFRLEIVPTNVQESVKHLPSHVKDTIMRDAISRMRCEDSKTNVRFSGEYEPTRWESNCTLNRNTNKWYNGCLNSTPCSPKRDEFVSPHRRSYEELRRLEQTREPDGIDIHVDRPLKENFWSHSDWALAMAKYRTLEDVAKDCDWECCEPMKGAEMFYRSELTPCCQSHVWDDDDLQIDNGVWCSTDSDWDDEDEFGWF